MSSAAEILAVCNAILLDAPPGEINDVFNDIRAILQNDSLLEQGIANGFQTYNKTNHHAITIHSLVENAPVQVILSTHNTLQDDENTFFSSKTRESFHYDPITTMVSHIQPYTVECPQEAYRASLSHHVSQYVQQHYQNGAFDVIDTQTHLVIVLSKQLLNPNNFWNGRVMCEWSAAYDNMNEWKGKFDIFVHYYEDGNVQMKCAKAFSCHVDGEDPADVVKTIKSHEHALQESLNSVFGGLSESFKGLKRALPVTRTKMDWNAISNYKIGSELKTSH